MGEVGNPDWNQIMANGISLDDLVAFSESSFSAGEDDDCISWSPPLPLVTVMASSSSASSSLHQDSNFPGQDQQQLSVQRFLENRCMLDQIPTIAFLASTAQLPVPVGVATPELISSFMKKTMLSIKQLHWLLLYQYLLLCNNSPSAQAVVMQNWKGFMRIADDFRSLVVELSHCESGGCGTLDIDFWMRNLYFSRVWVQALSDDFEKRGDAGNAMANKREEENLNSWEKQKKRKKPYFCGAITEKSSSLEVLDNYCKKIAKSIDVRVSILRRICWNHEMEDSSSELQGDSEGAFTQSTLSNVSVTDHEILPTGLDRSNSSSEFPPTGGNQSVAYPKSAPFSMLHETRGEYVTDGIGTDSVLQSNPPEDPLIVECDATERGANFGGPSDQSHAKSLRKRRGATRSFCYGDLEQHFDKSRGETAKILDISESTLKRVCRQHGIERWPFHYVNKNKNFHTTGNGVNVSITDPEEALIQASLAPARSLCKPSILNRFNQHQQGLEFQPTVVDQLVNTPEPTFSEPLPHDPCITGPVCSNPPSAVIKNLFYTPPPEETKQNVNFVTVKATYGDDTIRFELSSLSTIVDLEEEVTKRLNFEVGSFKSKYQDEDNDWILLACDEDLSRCMNIAKLHSWATIKMMIFRSC